MKNFIIILLGALVLTTSCTSTKRDNAIVIMDPSESIKREQFEKYISIIEQDILPNIGRKGKMSILFADECSLTQSERVFNLDLAKMDFSKSTDGLNHAEDSIDARMQRFLKDSIQAKLKNTILRKREERRACAGLTDILNALTECTSLIRHDRSYKSFWDKVINDAQGDENFEFRNTVFLFSDMVNENKEKTFDFTQMGKFNQDQVYKKLEDLRVINKVPDLSGCNVFVNGATAKAGPYANSQILNVRLFWEIYMKDAGANLQVYAYDSRREIQEYMLSAEK